MTANLGALKQLFAATIAADALFLKTPLRAKLTVSTVEQFLIVNLNQRKDLSLPKRPTRTSILATGHTKRWKPNLRNITEIQNVRR